MSSGASSAPATWTSATTALQNAAWLIDSNNSATPCTANAPSADGDARLRRDHYSHSSLQTSSTSPLPAVAGSAACLPLVENRDAGDQRGAWLLCVSAVSALSVAWAFTRARMRSSPRGSAPLVLRPRHRLTGHVLVQVVRVPGEPEKNGTTQQKQVAALSDLLIAIRKGEVAVVHELVTRMYRSL